MVAGAQEGRGHKRPQEREADFAHIREVRFPTAQPAKGASSLPSLFGTLTGEID